jgi:hypothetical protein
MLRVAEWNANAQSVDQPAANARLGHHERIQLPLGSMQILIGECLFLPSAERQYEVARRCKCHGCLNASSITLDTFKRRRRGIELILSLLHHWLPSALELLQL